MPFVNVKNRFIVYKFLNDWRMDMFCILVFLYLIIAAVSALLVFPILNLISHISWIGDALQEYSISSTTYYVISLIIAIISAAVILYFLYDKFFKSKKGTKTNNFIILLSYALIIPIILSIVLTALGFLAAIFYWVLIIGFAILILGFIFVLSIFDDDLF